METWSVIRAVGVLLFLAWLGSWTVDFIWPNRVMKMKPNWIDWAVYHLFYWRWNRILAVRGDLRAVYRQSWEQYEEQRKFFANQWNPKEWEPVRFVKGSSIDLDLLAEDECTFPEPPTGWQVYKRKSD